MITEKNFKKVLEKLGFEPGLDERWSKKIRGIEMAVDFEDGKLIYPEEQGLIVNDKTTSNFKHPENFVVFECVCRLLEKGYLAEHIELEHRWPLGRTSKGGKADILVKKVWEPSDGDFSEDNLIDLIIIECKTAGDEYDTAKELTELNGGQLFSYLQQSRRTKWLALYSSDWEDGNEDEDGKIVVVSDVIQSYDDASVLEIEEVDKHTLTYKKASTAVELFRVWEKTYERRWSKNLIFDPDSQPYKIGVPPLRKKDLEEFPKRNDIVNEFEEILRHNNVSDKENAFNRLLALFICKLKDEAKEDSDIVAFQYMQGESYEDLQDRLQELHQLGMEEFMREKITYVKKDYAKDLFRRYKGEDRRQAIKELDETIRTLKFYSNNDFAFKEVHNKELFLQNGKILVEVVKLFEPYRIVYPKKQQLLGDLFERLLNKGFKQNAGQFFTPIPITRFVWHSLPLREYCQKSRSLPKVIDYACGAGHFLTEAIRAINEVATDAPDYGVTDDESNTWVEKKIFGIEKDYRLARVSKISMFMNGAGGANIIFGDGLDNYPDKGIEANSFDILVANPPFSVGGFRPFLNLKNNKLQLLNPARDLISDDGGEIETLFVERIAQLLKPKGIAAVILPISFLDNVSGSYIAAREQILENFYLRAIVRLGSNTFGATDTNTVILFLERYDEPPRWAKLMEDCRNEIMKGSDLSDIWSDQEVLEDYLAHQGVSEDDFRSFATKKMEPQDVKNHPYFKIYAENFDWDGTKPPKKSSPEEWAQRVKEKFYEFALKREKEKIYYFALVRGQKTLVITAPTDNREEQDFLGYKWSARRRKEGIEIISNGGKLYNDKERFASGTLACAIRSSFAGEDPIDSLPKELQKYATTYCLSDMLDFSDRDFSKRINLSPRKRTQLTQFKYPTLRLSEVWRRIKGFPKVASSKILKNKDGNTPVVAQSTGKLIEGYTNTDSPITDLPLILFGDHTCVFKYIDFKFVAGADGCVLIKADEEKVGIKFLFFYLSSSTVEDKGKYARHTKNIKNTPIPIPPKEVQEKIVSECEAIDEEFNKNQADIEACRQKIANIFEALPERHANGQTELKNLDVSIVKGTSITRKKTIPGAYKVVAGGTNYAYTHNDFNREPPIITVSASGSAGYVNLWRERIFASDCTTIKCKTDTETVFLYYYLKSIQEFIYTLKKGGNQPHVYAADLKKILVPKISPKEQQTIVDKISSFERQIAEAQRGIEGCELRKRAIFDKYLK